MSNEKTFTISEFMALPLNKTYCDALKLPETTTLADLLALYAELRNKRPEPSVPAPLDAAADREYYKKAEEKLFGGSAADDDKASATVPAEPRRVN
ncbi:MAG TPA: hypothetical protein VK775_07310 [Chthoniobacterales bacterium]|jgi:hypothetical protein|nr:hypothetical protein [Chthoniobacterales bacterium]